MSSFILTCSGLWHNCELLTLWGVTSKSFWARPVRLRKDFNPAQTRPWVRFTLLGLVALLWLTPKNASASCGYYVVIGHPSSQTAAEQARLRHHQMPLEQKKSCNGPQCRGQDRPLTPVQVTVASTQDPILVAVKFCEAHDTDPTPVLIEDISFLSDPHIWRSDPPPRF
jgi:hypothetical protein